MTDSSPGAPEVNPRGIYKHAAEMYWGAGWRGVLPLPPGQKSSPPSGYTGYTGRDPSYADVMTWAEDNPDGNIALRLPTDVVGIDVDAYAGKRGAESLATLETDLGALPPTWTSTARTDEVSGIRLFRVPSGTRWREKFAGAGIELLHRGHRYAVVWPSTNPNADDAPYVWISPAGSRGIGVPERDSLPWLPSAWVGHLRERDDGSEYVAPAGVDVSVGVSDPFALPSRVFDASEAQAFVSPAYEAFKAMRTPEDSGFNQALDDLAVLVSHFVPEFWSQAQAVEWLYEAAEHNGSVAYQGAAGVRATIASGLNANTWKARKREPETDPSPASATLAGVTEPDMVDALLARMLDRDALDALPPPKPLIHGVLEQDSETWTIGPPGGFKSFVALDQAIHVALGIPWRGHRVEQGAAVYMAAEGSKGLPRRVRAWEAVYGRRVENIHFLPFPVQVSDWSAWKVWIAACVRLDARIIVLDTQARITVGMEENSNTEMGKLIEAVRRLKEATGACVDVVHHTGRNGGDARGASALDGAQDTELRVDRPADEAGRKALTATVSVDKQKDGDESATWEIQMRVVDLGEDEYGERITSLALEPMSTDPFGPARQRPAPDWESRLTENQADVLAALSEHGDAFGATRAMVRVWVKQRRAHDNRPDMPVTSFDSAVRDLAAREALVRKGGRIYLQRHLDEAGQ